MITGVSLRSADVAAQLNPQDGLYTLMVRGPEGLEPRIIGAVARVIVAPQEPQALRAALASPGTRIVSLTITEKGYGVDPATGGLDPAHPSIAPDLADPENATGAVGLIVRAIGDRRASGTPPFTVLCCDNLPSNGHVLKRLVLDFARHARPDLAAYIEAEVPFPSTMVDRITPASTERTFADVRAILGVEDRGAVETEPFSQWIVEENFASGRPAWEAGGALFVADVAPYERMKLRMLNGAHSMLAYSGFMAGMSLVRDVMADAAMRRLIARHMAAAAGTLDPVPGIDLGIYAADLRARFANPSIAHQTYQIAMDGTQKLPQRMFEPALEAMHRGLPLAPYAFALAAWMRYATGRAEDGSVYALRDPRQAEIAERLVATRGKAAAIADALMALPGLFPAALAGSEVLRDGIVTRLDRMLGGGMRAAIDAEAAGLPEG